MMTIRKIMAEEATPVTICTVGSGKSARRRGDGLTGLSRRLGRNWGIGDSGHGLGSLLQVWGHPRFVVPKLGVSGLKGS